MQIASAIAKTEQSIIDQQDAIASLRAEYEQLEQKKTFIEQAAQIRGTAAVADDLAEANRNLAVQADKVEQAENKLSRTTSSLGLLRLKLTVSSVRELTCFAGMGRRRVLPLA